MKTKIVLGVWLVSLIFVSTAEAVDRVLMLRVSTPLVVSGGAGVRLGTPVEGVMRPSVLVEAGVGGGRVAVGLDNTGEARFGYALKAALLRTWIYSLEVDENQTFLGLEGAFSIKKLVVNVGGYRRINDGDDDWLGSVGLGFLF